MRTNLLLYIALHSTSGTRTREHANLKLPKSKRGEKVITIPPLPPRRHRTNRPLPSHKFGRGLIHYDQSQCVKALGQYRVSAHGESKAQN